ncbi:MAG: cofactor-independent phosphoglycerate mutase, partial [Nitrospinota bacterium]
DVTNLGLLGYDPNKYYTGRAPLEAASFGVRLEGGDVAFRCNLVTLAQTAKTLIMDDFSAGHISTEQARELVEELNEKIEKCEITFYPGISYRHLMVWRNGPTDLELTPPHDISGQEVQPNLPKGERAQNLTDIMSDSQLILSHNRLNIEKKKRGEKCANSIWLWGHGKAPSLPSFKSLFNIEGSLVAAVDLMKGIGICAGLHIVDVPGATGYLDTNFEGKAAYALKELETKDFVYVHVEAPDEAGHNGSVKEKVKAIEDFDKLVVGKILDGMKAFSEYRILVVSDHRTPVSTKTHSSEDVPFAIFPSIDVVPGANSFSEKIAETNDMRVEKGFELIELLLQ